MKSSLRIVYSLIVFVLGIVLLSVLTVLLIYENRQTNLSFNQVNHTNIVRHSLEKVFSTLKDAESAHRGFLLTKDSTFLEPYAEIHSLPRQFANLDSLVAQDPKQKENVNSLKLLFEERYRTLESILQKTNAGTYKDDAALHSDLQADHQVMQRARQLVDEIQNIESDELVKRQDYAKRHSVLPTIIGIVVSIFSIIIFILAFYFTNAELKKSNHLNNELESKNLELEKYTKELSSFTDITSHDMQEPLRKIELFISLLEEREKQSFSPKALQYFEKIKESVNRMRQLFFSILTFSLADQVRNVWEEVDLNDVLRETLESLKVYIKDTNAVVSSDPLPKVKGVHDQLVQLFQNVISNALKYKRIDVIPEITITYEILDGKSIMSRDLKKDKKYYKVNFQDNGIGFDQKYVDKIFEIFQRHIRTEGNGIGIGLSICRKIAQNHSGTMTAESEINKGSLFSFYVPVEN
jgi:signal transduction histidine kinase